MKKFIIKNYAYVLLVFLAVIFTVLSAFGLGNLSSPSTYYQTGEMSAETTEEEETSYYNSLCYELNYQENKYSLDSVWINFGSMDYKNKDSEVIIYTSVASSESVRFYKINSFVKSDTGAENDSAILNTYQAVKAGDWQILCKTPTNYRTYKFFLLSTKNTVKINEIAFVGIDGDGNRVLLTATSVGAGGKTSYMGSNSPLSKSGTFPRTEEARALADNLIDEQNKFDLSKANFTDYVYAESGKMSETERFTLESVRNLTSGRGIALDLHANPLGQYLIALGVSVFGATSFGLRVIPFIFALLSLFVVFCIGKLITGKSFYGTVFAFLFTVGGYSLFFATTGKVDAIFAFFILCAFLSVIKFVKKGISDGAQRKGFFNLLSGGVSLAAAVSVKSTALFYVLPLIVAFAFGVIKQRAYAKRKGTEKSELFKRKFTATILLGVISYVFLPIIFVFIVFLSGYSAYSEYYQMGGLIEYGGRAGLDIFRTAIYGLSESSISSPIGFIINYSAQSESAYKFVFGNLALTIVNLILLVGFGAYVIYRFVNSENSLLFSSDKSLLTYVALSSFALFGWLLSFILQCGIGEFYLPSVFLTGITVLALKTFNEADKKSLIGNTLTATRIIAIALCTAITVFFALAVPAFIGLEANVGLYSWQVLFHAVI